MSGLDKDRFRNKTVSFRMSPNERRQLDSRIKVSGIPKGHFIIQSLLQPEINIIVGKYQSDRLSLEVRRLKDEIEILGCDADNVELVEVLKDCKILVQTLLNVIEKDNSQKLNSDDFRTEK